MNEEHINMLLGYELFGGLEKEEVNSLLDICETIRMSKGDILFMEGDTSRNAYVVLRGSLGVRKNVIDKKDDKVPLLPVIAEHGVGELVGEFSFFDAKPRSCEVFAIENTEAMVMNPENFKRYSIKYPEASRKIMKNIVILLITRVRKTDKKLAMALEWGWKTHVFDRIDE